jgi:hypothetical protein
MLSRIASRAMSREHLLASCRSRTGTRCGHSNAANAGAFSGLWSGASRTRSRTRSPTLASPPLPSSELGLPSQSLSLNPSPSRRDQGEAAISSLRGECCHGRPVRHRVAIAGRGILDLRSEAKLAGDAEVTQGAQWLARLGGGAPAPNPALPPSAGPPPVVKNHPAGEN